MMTIMRIMVITLTTNNSTVDENGDVSYVTC